MTLMAVAAVSWALATITTKVALEDLQPLDLLAVEVTAGTIAIWAVAWLRRAPLTQSRSWRYATLGLLEPALTYGLFDLGIDHTGAADAAVLVASDGVFSVALAWVLLRERSTRRVTTAVAVGFAGAVLVGLGDPGGRASVGGDALVLASSATAALYGVGARRIAGEMGGDALGGTAWQLLVGLVLIAPLPVVMALGGHSTLGTADVAHLLAAVTTGLLGSAIPVVLYNAAIGGLRIAASVVILNLVPVMGAGGAVLLLGDHLSLLQLGGATAIVTGALALGRQAGMDPAAPSPAAQRRVSSG